MRFPSRFYLLIVCLLWGGSLMAQDIIKEIAIVGCKKSQENMLIVHTGLKKENKLFVRDLQTGVRNLWKAGLFSDIYVTSDEVPEGYKITFYVKEWPTLKSFNIKGNTKIKEDKLKEKITLVPGMVISQNEVKKNIEKMLELYREKGYLQAKIKPEYNVPENDTNRVQLTFSIAEGQKVRIRGIHFIGNQAIVANKLRKQMKTKKKSLFRSGEFKEEQFIEDKDKIVRYYKKQGYRDAHIIKDSLVYAENLKDLYIKLFVEEGIRYKVGAISFEGNSKYKSEVLQKVMKFSSGEWYNLEKFEKSLEELGNIYREEGYLYVDIQDQVTIDSNRLNFNFVISEKDPVYVNKVLIKGNSKTKEKVIRREIIVFPGEIYRQSYMMRSFRDIMQLNFFGNVMPNVEPIDNRHVNIVFQVEEKPTGQVSLGAGWSERDKLVGTFSIGMPNFLGNGQLLDLNMDFGQYRKNMSIGFTEPWLMDTPTQAGFELRKMLRQWIDAFEQDLQGFSVWMGRRLTWPDDYFSASMRYRLDEQRLKNFSPYFNDVYGYKNEKWPRTTSSLTFSITRSSIDKPEFPNSGSINSFSYEIAGGPLGGSYNYHKEIFRSSWFYPTVDKFVLSLKMTFGHIDSYGGQSQVPYTEKFMIGGTAYDGQIRGYDDRSIHPENETAGNVMYIFNLEYTYPIVENQIYALLFADAGNSWKSMRRSNLLDLKKSMGFGARIVIPFMGIIGFDFGYGFDADNPGWKPHFQVGRPF